MHNMFFVKGDDYPCLTKHLQVSDQKHEVLEGTGFSVTNSRFRDAYLSVLESRDQTSSPVHVKFKV